MVPFHHHHPNPSINNSHFLTLLTTLVAGARVAIIGTTSAVQNRVIRHIISAPHPTPKIMPWPLQIPDAPEIASVPVVVPCIGGKNIGPDTCDKFRPKGRRKA